MNIFPYKTARIKWYAFISPVIFDLAVWVPTYFALKFFLHLKIDGKENLASAKPPFILACNHTNELDPILVKAVFGWFPPMFPIFYVAREREFYRKSGPQSLFYGGFFFRLWGAYPARVGMQDYELSLRNHIDILNTGRRCAVCVFPEGGIARNGDTKPPKGGVSYLSERTNTPIIPIAITGIAGMGIRDFFSMRRNARIIIGEPIYPQEFFPSDKTVAAYEHKHYAREIVSRIAKLMV